MMRFHPDLRQLNRELKSDRADARQAERDLAIATGELIETTLLLKKARTTAVRSALRELAVDLRTDVRDYRSEMLGARADVRDDLKEIAALKKEILRESKS